MRGNCYVTCEALYHLLGGKKAGYKANIVKHEGATHWFLTKGDLVIDPTRKQFVTTPNYARGWGIGFLTKKPSKRAKLLMKILLYQQEVE